MRTYETPNGTYKCGAYQSNLELWYGKVKEHGIEFITKQEFLLAVKSYQPPKLDLPPF